MKVKLAKALRHFKDDQVLKMYASSYRCLDICELILVRGKQSFIQLTIFRNKDIVLQGYNARKVNCGCVYSAYILKPVLSGRNL